MSIVRSIIKRSRRRREQLPNLLGAILWYRSDKGITIETGVSAWVDQSKSKKDVTQVTTTAQPVYTVADAAINNKPSLTFDGVNDSIFNNALSFAGSNYTLFVVAKINAKGASHYPVTCGTSGVGADEELALNGTAGNLVAFRTNNGAGNAVDATPSIGTWAIWTCTQAVGVQELFRNGVSKSTDTDASVLGTLDRIRIGARHNASLYFSGDQAEIILVPRVLTETKRKAFESQALRRYRLAA